MSDAIEVPLGGETYRFSPITLGDLRKFENRIKSERLRIAFESLPADIKADERAVIVREVLTGEVEVAEEIGSVGGVSYLLWLSVKHAQPDMKYESFADRLNTKDMGLLQTLIDKLAFGNAAGKENGDRPPAKNSSQAGEQS